MADAVGACGAAAEFNHLVESSGHGVGPRADIDALVAAHDAAVEILDRMNSLGLFGITAFLASDERGGATVGDTWGRVVELAGDLETRLCRAVEAARAENGPHWPQNGRALTTFHKNNLAAALVSAWEESFDAKPQSYQLDRAGEVSATAKVFRLCCSAADVPAGGDWPRYYQRAIRGLD